jgi:hypothetical protein
MIYDYFYFGKDCNITVPGSEIVVSPKELFTGNEVSLEKNDFKVTASPNPFLSSYAIDVKTSSSEKMSLSVYDLTGRLLEAATFNVNNISSKLWGDLYPAGIYTVIASQGDQTRMIRVVKQ